MTMCYEMMNTDVGPESDRGPCSPCNRSLVMWPIFISVIFVIVPNFAFRKGGTLRHPPCLAHSELRPSGGSVQLSYWIVPAALLCNTE